MKRKEPAEKARADTAFARLATDPDSVRGGAALTMMERMIRAHHDNRSPEPGVVVYWGTVFETWIMDTKGSTLDELLELTGAKGGGRSPIAVEFKRDMRNAVYMENMGLLVGAGFHVPEAAELITNHGDTDAFKKVKREQDPLLEPRGLIELFQEYGGTKWAREAGFFSDDPAIKARRDELVKRIPNKLLPARFR